jgi:thymidylate synthase ThyX
MPPEGSLRERDENKKQGSKASPIENEALVRENIQAFQGTAVAFYEHLLNQGVAPEIARAFLPQSMYTEFIET